MISKSIILLHTTLKYLRMFVKSAKLQRIAYNIARTKHLWLIWTLIKRICKFHEAHTFSANYLKKRHE